MTNIILPKTRYVANMSGCFSSMIELDVNMTGLVSIMVFSK